MSTHKSVAGGGLLDRRLFLHKSLSFSAMTVAGLAGVRAAEPASPAAETGLDASTGAARMPRSMTTPGAGFSNYGQPSPYEQHIVRWVAANESVPGNGVSWSPLHELEGMLTPNGLHFERHHNGVPDIDPEQHRLLLHGMVKQPLMFDMASLRRYPQESRIAFIECGGNSNALWRRRPIQTPAGYAHGLASCSEWTGVPLKLILNEAGIDADAGWLLAQGADAVSMTISIPMQKAMDDALLVLYQNGERLRPENGYPLRLLLPGWEGVTNVKWLRRLKAVREPLMSRNETARYTELLPSGKARQFSFIMQARSLITRPSLGISLDGPGLYQVSGLAWSGRGRIKRVEVSADAGKTWADAELQEPVLPKAFTRFRIPWRWDGSNVILQSRATDEIGYVQPDRNSLLEQRGNYGYFHFNGIVSWEIDEDGYISHVYA